MKQLLRPEFRGGLFGDPALYVRNALGREALLFDCGDLGPFSPSELLKVDAIFLSHCHIDHFYGFDHFLRVNVGAERRILVHGPPDSAARVGGKLAGYTWNLIGDQELEFVAVELDPERGLRAETPFRAHDGFRPGPRRESAWDPATPVFESPFYSVRTALLDHRTPSLAYAVEEKPSVRIDTAALEKLGRQPGPWINELKGRYLAGTLEPGEEELAHRILLPRQRQKLAYVTDGAASERNRRALIPLIAGADTLFHETCFLEADRAHADETRHFTAAFVARLAADAGAKALVPFHFSKRYIDDPDRVFAELRAGYAGAIERT